MRLSPVYQAIIKAEAIRAFGENVAVFLFGSRVDDSKKGGDIDLFIRTVDKEGLFKAFLLYQGENVDRPFLDILNELEKLHIVDVEEWFVLREIRNDIAHDYEDNQDQARHILNNIYQYRGELRQILVEIEQKTGALMAK